MKKSIFAVAVASALTLGAAQAETVLYGSVRFDYENKKTESWNNEGSLKNNLKNRVSNFNDLGSRIGLKGSEDLGNGNAVIYHLEWGFDGMASNATAEKDNNFSTRLAYMGFTGDWGTVAMGRQDNPFKVTIVDGSVMDDFNGVGSTAAQRVMHRAFSDKEALDGGNMTKTSLDRVGKSLAYVSPDFNGFGFNAAVVMDEELNGEKHLDLWTINAHYTFDMGDNGALFAKAGYLQGKTRGLDLQADETDNAVNSKAWGLNLGYSHDNVRFTAGYTEGRYNPAEGEKEKHKGWDVGISSSFGPNNYSTIRVAYGENREKLAGVKQDKVKSWAVGFEQKLSQRTRAWVEYGEDRAKFYGEDADPKLKDNKVSIGMRHDF